MADSRSSKSARNASMAVLAQLLLILVSFANRTLFVMVLGNEYLSVAGLLTSVMVVLSLFEAGISSAIAFSLYRPIADGERTTVAALIAFQRIAYYCVAMLTLVVGLALIPFLSNIIDVPPGISEQFAYIYMLFLANMVLSYLFSYRRSLLLADQKDYVLSKVLLISSVVSAIVVNCLLFLLRDYIVYLAAGLAFSVATEVFIFIKVGRLYPFLAAGRTSGLRVEEKAVLWGHIRSIALYRVGSVSFGATDNLVIPATVGLSSVGLTSNYVLLVNSLSGVATRAFESLSGAVGNLNVGQETVDRRVVFDEMYFLSFWIFGLASVLLGVLLNPFVQLWLGEDYVVSQSVVLCIVFSMYVLGMNIVPSIFRSSLGLFRQARFAPLIAAGLNVLLTIQFARTIGLPGVFLATGVSRLLTFGVVDPVLVFSKGFRVRVRKFYARYAMYSLIALAAYLILDRVSASIRWVGIIGLLGEAVLCFAAANGLFLLCLWRTEGFRSARYRAGVVLASRHQRRSRPSE